MLRQLTRKDLPKKTGINSMHTPVVYQNKLRFVYDISYGSSLLCWLEDNDGIPVQISECELITNFKEYKKIVSLFSKSENHLVSAYNHLGQRERNILFRHFPEFKNETHLATTGIIDSLLTQAQNLER